MNCLILQMLLCSYLPSGCAVKNRIATCGLCGLLIVVVGCLLSLLLVCLFAWSVRAVAPSTGTTVADYIRYQVLHISVSRMMPIFEGRTDFVHPTKTHTTSNLSFADLLFSMTFATASTIIVA
mgnify:CR=1 FL=1